MKVKMLIDIIAVALSLTGIAIISTNVKAPDSRIFFAASVILLIISIAIDARKK
jgi:uncharacterized membrane protein YtjA (UPF0391 family)